MSNDKGLQYLNDLGAEIAGLYAAVRADLPDATEDELRDEAVQRYVRMHDPALFRVGVTFTPEQEAKIREFVQRDQLAKAQNIILDELKKEFPNENP